MNRKRHDFDKPLIDEQWIRFTIAELLTGVEALRQLTYHC